MTQQLTELQESSCRRAAARFYRAGGRYNRDEFEDVVQDARVIAIIEKQKNPNLVGRPFEECVRRRLIDKYRRETGCRYLRSHGLDPIRFYSLDSYEEHENNKTRDAFRANPITKRIVQEWIENNEEKRYRVITERDGDPITLFLTETDLETIIRKTLAGSSPFERKCVLEYVYGDKTMRQIGLENERCESRVSQILSQFKRRIKEALIREFKE